MSETKVVETKPIEFYSTNISILQQSQSKLALEYLTSKGYIPTVEELWRITEVFVLCCLQKQDVELKKRIIALDKWVAEKTNPTDQLKQTIINKLSK
jgi:hypothetical protein